MKASFAHYGIANELVCVHIPFAILVTIHAYLRAGTACPEA